MRELPRKLSADELAELFEGRTRLVERLAPLDDPLTAANGVVRELSDDEKVEALNAHPAIGAGGLSGASAREQGQDAEPELLAELERLNRDYERRFGFRFVVFVNRRPKSEILPILQERLGRTREQELETALDEIAEIARLRLQDALP